MKGAAGSFRLAPQPLDRHRKQLLVVACSTLALAAGWGLSWDWKHLDVDTPSARAMSKSGSVNDRSNAVMVLHKDIALSIDALITLASEPSPAGADARNYLEKIASKAARGLCSVAADQDEIDALLSRIRTAASR